MATNPPGGNAEPNASSCRFGVKGHELKESWLPLASLEDPLQRAQRGFVSRFQAHDNELDIDLNCCHPVQMHTAKRSHRDEKINYIQIKTSTYIYVSMHRLFLSGLQSSFDATPI